jgi:membrane protein DedA with SNARE-associated domain
MTEQAVVQLIADYGYLGIFFLLVFGIVGLPIPDEWLLVLAGYLAFKEVLDLFPTLAIAAIGTAGGLTVSYLLGRSSGDYVVRRYGRWLSIDEHKIQRTQQWFENLGRCVLIVGPFIPGVRNLMGYIAGASKLRMRTFARFAYVGALLSSTTFVTFGYLVGRHVNWNYSTIPLIAVAAAVAFTVSGAPFRIVRLIKKKLPAATIISANRPIEASIQAACIPKK